MNREDALEILRLDDDATISDAHQSMCELINKAQLKNKPSRIASYKRAYEIIKETDGQAVGSAEQFIAYDGFKPPEKREAPRDIQRIPPYEEAVIKDRIAKLPRRVAVLCGVTGERYSMELTFDKMKNAYSLKNPMFAKDEPLITEIVFPVMDEDIQDTNERVDYDINDRGEAVFAAYRERAVSDEIAQLLKAYSLPTSLNTHEYEWADVDQKLSGNDKEFGHSHACSCCGSSMLDECFDCGGVVCKNGYQKWPQQLAGVDGNHEIDCPYCGLSRAFRYTHPKTYARLKEELRNKAPSDSPQGTSFTYVRERKIAAAIGQEKRQAVAHSPVKRIEKKMGG